MKNRTSKPPGSSLALENVVGEPRLQDSLCLVVRTHMNNIRREQWHDLTNFFQTFLTVFVSTFNL